MHTIFKLQTFILSFFAAKCVLCEKIIFNRYVEILSLYSLYHSAFKKNLYIQSYLLCGAYRYFSFSLTTVHKSKFFSCTIYVHCMLIAKIIYREDSFSKTRSYTPCLNVYKKVSNSTKTLLFCYYCVTRKGNILEEAHVFYAVVCWPPPSTVSLHRQALPSTQNDEERDKEGAVGGGWSQIRRQKISVGHFQFILSVRCHWVSQDFVSQDRDSRPLTWTKGGEGIERGRGEERGGGDKKGD